MGVNPVCNGNARGSMKNYDSTQIRSFALAGHAGSGKTSVADAIARTTKLNNRLGSPADGSSLLDYEPEEKERGGSLSSSFLTCEYDGYKIHVVDTPGDGDFIHDAYSTIQGTDACVLVVSATDGVEVGTEKMNTLAEEVGAARAVFINKLDRERASHEGVLAELKEVLNIEPVLLQLPIGTEGDFRGVVDLVNKRAFIYSDDSGIPSEQDIPADMADEVEAAVEAMAEQVAMTDDELVEKFLEEGELSEAEIRAGLNKGIITGAIVPVVLGAAAKNIAIDKLLWVTRAFPSPVGRPPVTATANGELSEVAPDPSGPFVAQCFKTIIDPFMGHLSLFRCFSGSGGTDLQPTNSRSQREERFGTLFHLVGKKTTSVDRVTTGDIFAVAKLKHTRTTDTLCGNKEGLEVEWHPTPKPMISYVLKPKTRADEDKIRGALEKVLAEDPGLTQTFDDVTKEIVLSGRGANHISMTVAKMERRYGINLELGTPTIPYRETISGTADVRYRHKKQTGGAGQFGEVAIRVRQNERGRGFEFVDKTVGGVIPNSLIPSVEKGVVAQLDKGILAGFPCLDVYVELYDGKSHPVDSKDIAFQIAGRQAIKQAVEKARPVLLEPIYYVEVTAPEAHVGDIMGDMNQRRARIQSMDSKGRNSIVKATVPLAEMLNYAPALKSMTQGKGTYTMEFQSYDPVPHSMQEKLVAEVSRIRSGDDDD